jgi:hypothetical protein
MVGNCWSGTVRIGHGGPPTAKGQQLTQPSPQGSFPLARPSQAREPASDNHPESLTMAESNASAIKIVGRQLHRDHIALNDFDEKFSHLAGNMGQDQMLIF